jgi:hypothetical protein
MKFYTEYIEQGDVMCAPVEWCHQTVARRERHQFRPNHPLVVVVHRCDPLTGCLHSVSSVFGRRARSSYVDSAYNRSATLASNTYMTGEQLVLGGKMSFKLNSTFTLQSRQFNRLLGGAVARNT